MHSTLLSNNKNCRCINLTPSYCNVIILGLRPFDTFPTIGGLWAKRKDIFMHFCSVRGSVICQKRLEHKVQDTTVFAGLVQGSM